MTKTDSSRLLRSFAHHSAFDLSGGEFRLDCSGITNRDTLLIIRVLFAALLFTAALLLSVPRWLSVCLLVLCALIAGFDLILTTVSAILSRQIRELSIAAVLLSIACFALSGPKDGAAVILLFQLVELLIRSLLFFTVRKLSRTDTPGGKATFSVEREGRALRLSSEQLLPGDDYVLPTGARVPVDSAVVSGGGAVDLSFLTGDNTPITVREDEEILGGAKNIGVELHCQAVARPEDSADRRAAAILEDAGKDLHVPADQARRTRRLLPALVLIAAVLTAFILSLTSDLSARESVARGIGILVFSFPGSLLAAVPIAYYASCRASSKGGVIIRNACQAEVLSRVKNAVIEKSGTLTAAQPRVISVRSDRMDADTLLKIAAHVEAYSAHPLAKSIISAYGGVIYIELIQNFREFPGEGIAVTVRNIPILLGSRAFLARFGIDVPGSGTEEQAAFLSVGREYVGRLLFGSSIKSTATNAIQELENSGVSHISVLSQDGAEASRSFAETMGLRDVHSYRNEEDCTDFIRAQRSKQRNGQSLLFTAGKDAFPEAMAQADISAIISDPKSALDCRSADVLVFDDPARLADAVANARFARGVAQFGRGLALVLKLAGIILSGLGLLPIWLALPVEAVICMATVLQALRASSPVRRVELPA